VQRGDGPGRDPLRRHRPVGDPGHPGAVGPPRRPSPPRRARGVRAPVVSGSGPRPVAAPSVSARVSFPGRSAQHWSPASGSSRSLARLGPFRSWWWRGVLPAVRTAAPPCSTRRKKTLSDAEPGAEPRSQRAGAEGTNE